MERLPRTPISADWGDFAPRELTDKSNRLSYIYGVMLNRQGKRFVDEGEDGALFTYAKFGRAILAQPGASKTGSPHTEGPGRLQGRP